MAEDLKNALQKAGLTEVADLGSGFLIEDCGLGCQYGCWSGCDAGCTISCQTGCDFSGVGS
jgi:hypothetical protein